MSPRPAPRSTRAARGRPRSSSASRASTRPRTRKRAPSYDRSEATALCTAARATASIGAALVAYNAKLGITPVDWYTADGRDPLAQHVSGALRRAKELLTREIDAVVLLVNREEAAGLRAVARTRKTDQTKEELRTLAQGEKRFKSAMAVLKKRLAAARARV